MRALLLATLSLLPARSAAGKFDAFADCASCVAGGHGWSLAKSKCGGFKTKVCPAVPPPPPPPAPPVTVPAADPAATTMGVDPHADATEFYGKLPVVGELERVEWDYEVRAACALLLLLVAAAAPCPLAPVFVIYPLRAACPAVDSRPRGRGPGAGCRLREHTGCVGQASRPAELAGDQGVGRVQTVPPRPPARLPRPSHRGRRETEGQGSSSVTAVT